MGPHPHAVVRRRSPRLADAGLPRDRLGAPGIGARPVQGGTTFTFRPPAAGARLVLRAVVDVEWRRGGQVLDRARVPTTTGHADAADPYLTTSQTSCEIVR